jgi:hypothetical protein
MIAMHFGHLGRFVTIPDVSDYLFEASEARKLFLLSLEFNISDTEGVSSTGE